MINCEEAALISSKKQYKEATFWERINLKVHLLACKVCSKFTKKNAQLTQLFEKSKLYALSEEEKLKMNRELQSKS